MKEKDRFLIFIEVAVCLIFFLFVAAFSARGFARAYVKLSDAWERDEAVQLCEMLAEHLCALPNDVNAAASAAGADIYTDEAGVSLITLKGNGIFLFAEHTHSANGCGNVKMSVKNSSEEIVYSLNISLFEGEQSQ